MRLWLAVCRDGADGARLRREHLAAHLAHVEANMARYAVAGPLDADGGTMGSMLAVRADDADDARAFIAADPYARAGVWAAIEVWGWKPVAGDWIGGATWKR